MSSGVAVDPDCFTQFTALRVDQRLKYIVYSLNQENTQIVIVGKSESQNYQDFIAELPKAECRWAVYNLEYEKDGGKRKRIFFLSWKPDDAKLKDKMVLISSTSVLRSLLVGISVDISGADDSDVAYDTVVGICGGKGP